VLASEFERMMKGRHYT